MNTVSLVQPPIKPGSRLSIHRSLGPIRLDVLAAVELQHGHHAAAEHLSRLAAEQRKMWEVQA